MKSGADPIAYIPYGAYWSTPFARWQGALAELHSLKLAAWTAGRALARRGINAAEIDGGVLGFTVPQTGCFYGLPYVAGMMGAPHLAGPTIMQACATSMRLLSYAAGEVLSGQAGAVLAIAADRVSNGPTLSYPQPTAPGGAPEQEHWVLGNFARDPFAGAAMVETAENVARKHGVTREEQDAITLRRQAQYADALADDRTFQRRYMEPDLPDRRFAKVAGAMAGDEGVQPPDEAKLRALEPVREGGTVTYAGQTHPADGNAGMVIAARDRARALAREPIEVAILGFGQARVEPAFMPEAPVPATKRALAAAGVEMAGVDAVKSHNPFAVNDAVFAMATGFPVNRMNNYGCSLIWGHPQGPTGMRGLIELIEELAIRGGGVGLFQGCAAGDSAMAAVIRVGDAR